MDIAYNSFVSQPTYESTKAPIINKPSTSDTMNPLRSLSISFNYPLTFATKLQPSYTGYIHYSFQGKENEPNIILQSYPTQPTQFVSKDLYIFSRIHDFPDMPPFDGELVIAHEPLTNGVKPFYMCFPLKSAATAPKTVICDLMTTEDDAIKPTEINIMSALDSTSPAAYYYETPYASIAVAREPIKVPTSFVGFNRGKIDDLWEPPRDVLIAQLRSGSGSLGSSSASHPLAWIVNPIKEGWTDAMCDGSYCYFDCDYTDPGYENEVPTYRIPAGSDVVTLKEKMLNYAISAIWLIAILILTVWLGPFIFSVIGSRKATSDKPDTLAILDNIEGGIGQLLFIPAIALISIGVPKNLNCAPNDDKCVEDSNKLIAPGAILLAVWFFYFCAMFIYKLFIPDFVGYRDPVNKAEPYMLYGKEDIRIVQYFNPISLLMLFYYLFT